MGDSLRSSIDKGLSECDFGVIILSDAFFLKQWTKIELNGLVSIENRDGQKRILPVWHMIDIDFVREKSPLLSDRIGIDSAIGIAKIVKQIEKAINPPSPYQKILTLDLKSEWGGKIFIQATPNEGHAFPKDADLSKVFSLEDAERLIGSIEDAVGGKSLKK